MNNSLEDLFRNSLGNMDVAPPPGLWDKLDTHLAKSDVSSLYRERFKNDEEEPPRGVWFAIQRQLWMQQFFRFNVARLNAYYVAGALLAGTGMMYMFSDPAAETTAKAPIVASTTTVAMPTASLTKPLKNIEPQETILHSASTSKPAIARAASKPVTTQLVVSDVTSDDHLETQHKNSQPEIVYVDFPKNLTVQGDKVVCENSEHNYALIGAVNPQTQIRWQVAATDGVVTELAPNKVMVDWRKEGASQITVQLVDGNRIAQTTYAVKVVDNESSKIIGKSNVCDEIRDIQYRVDNKQDLNKMYTWETTKKQAITVVSNGFIKVNFASVGLDSIILHETNTQTGCISRVAIPVQVNEHPIAGFSIREKGSGEFEFINNSQCAKSVLNCQLRSKWVVGDNTYQAQNLRYQFDVSGAYTINLTVEDQNGCVNSYEKEVQIVVGKLFLPNAYSFSGRLSGFAPVAENLSSYKIEIFTADNRKIWESSALSDGKPTEAWDGTVNGERLPLGTYFWRIQASFRDGGEWKGILQNGQYMKNGSFFLLD